MEDGVRTACLGESRQANKAPRRASFRGWQLLPVVLAGLETGFARRSRNHRPAARRQGGSAHLRRAPLLATPAAYNVGPPAAAAAATAGARHHQHVPGHQPVPPHEGGGTLHHIHPAGGGAGGAGGAGTGR